jgi:2'-5' RNA ligase
MKYLANYADEKLWEEDWKREYKYGSILIIPPKPIKKLTDNLRKKYDPQSYKNCVAHISLTMPIRHVLTTEDKKELEQNIKRFKSFKVNYGPVANFLPGAVGVVFKINNQQDLKKLCNHIENTSGVDFYPRKRPFIAHLTIAEFIDKETTVRLTRDLNKQLQKDILYGEFVCDKVTYMVPDENFVFQEIQSFDLG